MIIFLLKQTLIVSSVRFDVCAKIKHYISHFELLRMGSNPLLSTPPYSTGFRLDPVAVENDVDVDFEMHNIFENFKMLICLVYQSLLIIPMWRICICMTVLDPEECT